MSASLNVAGALANFAAFGSREHLYELETPMCQAATAGCTLENVFMWMRLIPAPLWLVSDLRSSLVETGDIGFAGSFLPGGFVRFRVNKAVYEVVNETLPAHLLYKGTVTRQALVKNGSITIKTVGEGKNFSSVLAFLNKVYGKHVFRSVDFQTFTALNYGFPWELW
jgi:hypothetical protein